MEGLDGIEKRKRLMQSLRLDPPASFGGYAVKIVKDYESRRVTNLVSGSVEETDQPKSDVLYYTLENDDKIIVRPSGTEPKIKIYILAHADNSEKLSEKLHSYELDVKRITEV